MKGTTVIFAAILLAGCAAPRANKEASMPTVAYDASRKITVYLGGQVKSAPAQYQYSLPEGTRLWEAVSRAGGFTEWSAKWAVRLQRKNGKLYQYDLRRIKPGSSEDPVLEEGDVIHVPMRM